MALGWGWYTYEPGTLLYGSEVAIRLPADEPLPSSVEILRRSKALLDSEVFRMQAIDRLAALQTQRVRQLGPGQLVEVFEGSQDSIAKSLLSSATLEQESFLIPHEAGGGSFSVRLDEVSPTLILSVSGASQPLVSAILEVVPDLLVKIHTSHAAIALRVIASEIQQKLTEVEQQELNLAQILWNLKGKLNTKFADRPISKRGSTPGPSPTAQTLTTISSSTATSLDSVREKLSGQLDGNGFRYVEGLPSLGQAWKLLDETLQLGNTADSLIQEASALFPLLDAAESMETGPLPENLSRLNLTLQNIRGQREEIAVQTAQLIPSITGTAPAPEQSLLVEKEDIQVRRVGGSELHSHYLLWGLRGLGVGVVFALAVILRPSKWRRARFS